MKKTLIALLFLVCVSCSEDPFLFSEGDEMSYTPNPSSPETTKLPPEAFRSELPGLARRVGWPAGEPGIKEEENTWEQDQLYNGEQGVQFGSGSQSIRKDASGENVIYDAGSSHIFQISGNSELAISANLMKFVQGLTDNVDFDWSDAFKLHFRSGVTNQVTFTNGTFEPVTDNDILLGTSTRGWAGGFYSGPLRMNTNSRVEFRDSGQFIYSPVANLLFINAGTSTSFLIGGVSEVSVSATGISITDKVTAKEAQFTIATGTAPIVVTSTTVCANLNVDQVDGKDASELNPITTKGDLSVFTTVPARLAVGSNTHVLTADSSEASGMKWAAGGGGSGVSDVLGFSAGAATVAKGATDFVGFGAANVTSTEANAEFYIPIAGTIKNLRTYLSANASNNGSNLVTIRKNGADTILLTTYDAAETGLKANTSDSFTVVAGDRIAIEVTNTGSGGGTKNIVVESVSIELSS